MQRLITTADQSMYNSILIHTLLTRKVRLDSGSEPAFLSSQKTGWKHRNRRKSLAKMCVQFTAHYYCRNRNTACCPVGVLKK